ncbi:MAG: hypothetical protein GY771_00870 [bacterium]|nr:hypothetical protein [bacterium]
MRKIYFISAFFAVLTFCPACTLCGGDDRSETPDDTETVTDLKETPPDYPPDEQGPSEEPENDDDRYQVFVTSDRDGECEPDLRSVKIIESSLPNDVTDEIFVEYKTIRVYYSGTNDYGEALELIIEFSNPYFSPYIGKVTLEDIEVYKGSSSGANELVYDGPAGSGEVSTSHETHLLTYNIDIGKPFVGTATIVNLGMTYDLEQYGTGGIRAKLHIEP